MIRYFPLPILAILGACGGASSPAPTPPAKAEPVAHESELLKLTLTPQAQARLGIVTVQISAGAASHMRETSGEIVVPNTAGGVPTGSLSNLAQIGASQAMADGEVARTHAQVRGAGCSQSETIERASFSSPRDSRRETYSSSCAAFCSNITSAKAARQS